MSRRVAILTADKVAVERGYDWREPAVSFARALQYGKADSLEFLSPFLTSSRVH